MGKAEDIQKTGIFLIGFDSQKVKDEKVAAVKGIIKPKDSFSHLIEGYDNSFILGGIADKVAGSCAV